MAKDGEKPQPQPGRKQVPFGDHEETKKGERGYETPQDKDNHWKGPDKKK